MTNTEAVATGQDTPPQISKTLPAITLYGIDFTSAPTRRKPITVAGGILLNNEFSLTALSKFQNYELFENWLMQPGPWLGVFDLPFSLPRELIETLGWPTDFVGLIEHIEQLTRPELRQIFKAFCDERPPGNKFAHRATDIPAKSSSSMKWVNPPVAFMLHAGMPRLLKAGLHLPGMYQGDLSRIALEGYPGLIARSISKASYKSDTVKKQTGERKAVRIQLVDALNTGNYLLGIKLKEGSFQSQLVDDGSGDLLDAVFCALSAAWAWDRRDRQFGLPSFDPLEGWIVGA